MSHTQVTLEGNEAVAHVAFRTNEVIAIYPITPSSAMGELCDAWSNAGLKNIWGTVPTVVEMQAEGGAAGAVHGALQAGALTTTFTASQGLLLMIPNMFKIAGELTSAVIHVSARSVAAQALSIFGDHSDVMATRTTGFGMLSSCSVQEAHDFALIAKAATLEARVPFLHFFDGFRTSHEINKISLLDNADIAAMIDDAHVRQHRARALSPAHPAIRGTAQNPDVFFQARESCNPYYLACPEIVEQAMNRFAERVGRQYKLFDYVGAPDAERVVVMMGSGAEAAHETVDKLTASGEKVGLLKVRLYRPFAVERFLAALPPTVRSIGVLDRTKEPGAIGEPLYQDVVTAISEGLSTGAAPFERMPRIVGGRYGLSSKEFTPAMVKGVFDHIKQDQPKNHFTVGIVDDLTFTSIDYDPSFDTEPADTVRALFYGLGADGTVGANKNSVKIIGEETDLHAQGYFVYDSRKSGAQTVSHLRFGQDPIRSTYLVQNASFVACHQFGFMERTDVLEKAAEGATFLLNSPYGPEDVWDRLPRSAQQNILDKNLKMYVIDAYGVAREAGLRGRINTIMQTCFFAISGVLPRDEAIEQIKKAIKKTYGKRGEVVVQQNYKAVDAALGNLHQVELPVAVSSTRELALPVPAAAPAFVQDVTAMMIAGKGDQLPVSALPNDGTYPTGTTQWEKRNIAQEIPLWEPDLCIQCGKCVLVCPHAVIRAKLVEPEALEAAPDGFLSMDAKFRELPDQAYTLQVAIEDCTGCQLCVESCPAKDKSQVGRKALNMVPQRPLREQGAEHWDYFTKLPEVARTDGIKFNTVRSAQLLEPLFEFSGACAGCGETPYVKLVSQLFGDRTLIANATGCSSIYGGNLPTTPWAQNAEGRGPAWSNSLFEDNAEFGYGFRLTLDKQAEYARELVGRMRDVIGGELADDLLNADQSDEAGIFAQRERIAALRSKLDGRDDPASLDLHSLAETLAHTSVWIMGGDGWAYDIGYGGLDHVLASGRNVNVLVLDTEVYSNTGGQASKATPLGAVAKFAAGGKPTAKKDLGLMAMSYGSVYVAQVCMGANDAQTMRAFLEAEAYPGPSLIIAYSPCIAHGIDMTKSLQQQSLAVSSAYWPLYRYDPQRSVKGQNPMQLDSRPPKIPLKDYIYNEGRYRMLAQAKPDVAAQLLEQAQEAVNVRWANYERMARKEQE